MMMKEKVYWEQEEDKGQSPSWFAAPRLLLRLQIRKQTQIKESCVPPCLHYRVDLKDL